MDAVVLLTAPRQTLLRRIIGRQTCRICQSPYNIFFSPTRVEAVCDLCGGDLHTRSDDNMETARHRLDVYEQQTRPLADFYRETGAVRGRRQRRAGRGRRTRHGGPRRRRPQCDRSVMSEQVGPADGSQVIIRRLREEDLDGLLAFGAALPQDDWLYLDIDLQTHATIIRLINAVEARNWRQLVAVGRHPDRRLRERASTPRLEAARRRHRLGSPGRLPPPRCRLGAGGRVARCRRGDVLDKLIVEVVEEQAAGQLIFKRIGFSTEGRLVNHAVDYLDNPRNLVLLSYHLPARATS